MGNKLMLHHIHKHLKEKKKKQPIDYIVRFFMIATPLFELPQAYIIYSTKSAVGVSIFTWVFFCLASVVWFIYAYKLHLFPLMVAYALYLIIEIIIVIGIVLYS